MPKFAANISLLFTELPFLERFAAAKRAGFVAIECQFPYPYPLQDLRYALRESGLPLILHNLPGGDWAKGERGIACLPGREGEFRESVHLCLEYAQNLGCRQVNCLAGIAPNIPEHEKHNAETVLLCNLDYASRILSAADIHLLIEPINQHDIPGYLVRDCAHAAQLIQQLQQPHQNNTASATTRSTPRLIGIQYDIYHAQRSHGELAHTLARYAELIKHIQIADNPGRHEPGSGEINYAWLLPHIDGQGYQGYIGCEYIPRQGTEDGLNWMRQYTEIQQN